MNINEARSNLLDTDLNFVENVVWMLLISEQFILQAAAKGRDGLHAWLSHFQTWETLCHGAASAWSWSSQVIHLSVQYLKTNQL